MKITIAHEAPMRRWQQRLADALRDQGHDVAFAAKARRRASIAVTAALSFERRVFGSRRSLFDPVPSKKRFTRSGETFEPDLTIALDGVCVDAPIVLEPEFDGGTGDVALLKMATRGHTPHVEVRTTARAETIDVVDANLAVENRKVVSRALDQVLARVVTLIEKGVRRCANGEGRPLPRPQRAVALPDVALLPSMVQAWIHKIAGRIPGVRRDPTRWCIGYRRLPDVSGTARSQTWPAQRFTILPDDGSRFYADPVPFEHEGRSFLFLEDYPYATGKAVIAMTEIAADGSASPVRPVLELPWHLSYPFLIRHRGEIYMSPEMSRARRVQLFRAAPFPDRWVPDRVLLDDIVAADATFIEHGGRWWMFATVADDGGSCWDQLCLFHAPDLLGPWEPHADNPVLVDAGAARPAGAMWHAEDGTLMRVAQDCRTGYGVGLAICRVDRLDERTYAQTVVTRLAPPDGYGADGVHTLDRVGNLEVIDLHFPSALR